MNVTTKEDALCGTLNNDSYRVMLLNDIDIKSKRFLIRNETSSGIKSHETKYKEGLVSKPLGKGLTIVTHLLLWSGIPMLCELGNDIKKTVKF